MSTYNELVFRNRKEWRKWLEKNSGSSEGIWMLRYKKHTGKECVPYVEAVEEALCFGWIDGKIKRINDEYFVQYYTPRRSGSRWSKYNIDRVERLISQGRMTDSGMRIYKEVLLKPHLAYENRASGDPEIPGELLTALKGSDKAFKNFMNFSPSSRRIYIEWYKYAKRDKTRLERIKRIVKLSEQNQRPGMM